MTRTVGRVNSSPFGHPCHPSRSTSKDIPGYQVNKIVNDEQDLRSALLGSIGISVFPLLFVFPGHFKTPASCCAGCTSIVGVVCVTGLCSPEHEPGSAAIQTQQSCRHFSGVHGQGLVAGWKSAACLSVICRKSSAQGRLRRGDRGTEG